MHNLLSSSIVTRFAHREFSRRLRKKTYAGCKKFVAHLKNAKKNKKREGLPHTFCLERSKTPTNA